MKKSIRLRARALARFSAPALSVLSLAVSASVQAQGIEVNPVVVSASRMEQPLSYALSSVSVIGRADIDKSQAVTLADLLQGEAGFEFGRNGGPGTTTSFFMRGQDSTNVVVMVDGVRAQTDGIGSLTMTDYPLGQIEKIEILRGNAGALYGESAIGGVINIQTRKGKGAPQAYGSMSYGTYNTRGVTVGYGGELDGKSFDLNAGGAKSDGFSTMNKLQNPLTNSGDNGYSKNNIALRFENKVTQNLNVGVRVSSNTSDTSYDKNSPDTYLFKTTNDAYSIYARQQISDKWNSSIDLTHATLKYQDFKNASPLPASDGSSALNGKQNALRWNNVYEINPNQKVVFGIDVLRDDYDANGTYGYRTTRNTNGYFAGLTSIFDKLTTQVNLRHDQVSVDRTESNQTKLNTTNISTGLLGAGYQIDRNWRLTTTVSTAFRAPTAYEAYTTPSLKPETHNSKEAGASYQSEQSLTRLVYFETATSNAIISPDWVSYVNVGEVRNKGLEATLRANWRGHSIKASLVSQDPWDVTNNKALERRARHYGSVDISRPLGAYDVGSRVYMAGSRTDTDWVSNGGSGTSVVSNGYALWSFYASRKIDNEWTARVKLENAFDRQYQLAYGYNTPGRGIYATLQYQPK
jgi:vitamin B12 transporter